MAKEPARKRRFDWKTIKAEADDFRQVLDLANHQAATLRWLLGYNNTGEWTMLMDLIRRHKAGELANVAIARRLYHEYSQSKGVGRGRRYFAAPHPLLKTLQQHILHRFLRTIPVNAVRKANQYGQSILDHAATHVGAQSMFAVDILHAFPTVKRSRLRKNLRKPWIHYCNTMVQGIPDSEKDVMLEAILDLITLYERLPQGPPTSPYLLDICCRMLDRDLVGVLGNATSVLQHFTMSAWVDDFVFSTDSAGPFPDDVQAPILGAFKDHGYMVHPAKTEHYDREHGDALVVCGLVVGADGRITMVPSKVKVLAHRLYQLCRVEKLDTHRAGLVTGLLGFIRQVYPARLPGNLRSRVETAEQKLAVFHGRQLPDQQTIGADAPAPSDTDELPGSSYSVTDYVPVWPFDAATELAVVG